MKRNTLAVIKKNGQIVDAVTHDRYYIKGKRIFFEFKEKVIATFIKDEIEFTVEEGN